ncbi:MAG: hypothetical protein H5T86_01515, partial [Armatimonadetes bacterium]|nr:hypothetical protein [Armatimonadota bacterium]
MTGKKVSVYAVSSLAAALVFACIGECAAALSVEGAAYLPDTAPSFPWAEGAKDISDWSRTSYRPGCLVRVWLRNSGNSPVSLRGLRVGDEYYEAGQDIRGKEIVWFRLRPDPLPPASFGEMEVRFRKDLSGASSLVLDLENSPGLTVEIEPQPPSLSIERIAFSPSGETMIWSRCKGELPTGMAVIVDGKQLPASRCEILGPWHGVFGVVVKPDRPFGQGAFHFFAIKNARGIVDAAVVRARDDFFPLGTYGYVQPRDYAANSLNLYASFSTLARGALDAIRSYGLRAITPGEGSPLRRPAKATIGHPGIWAYYLHDEPDVADYYVEDLPHTHRIGTHAMQMVDRDRAVYGDDPGKLSYLVIDQTYKPANWYVYGPIADVCATDCYPGPGEWQQVFATTETCRLACKPRMLVFIFRAYWQEDKEASEQKDRMMYAGEERIHIAAALAAGAQGLIAYIHCTEPSGKGISHGAGEYPDVWHAIGQMYREVETVAPVLAGAIPVDGIVEAPQGIWARGLVSPLGMGVVLVNQAGCESTPTDFLVRPANNVPLRLHLPPWLAQASPAMVGEGELQAIESARNKQTLELTVPTVETAALVMVARPEVLADLEKRYQQILSSRGSEFLRGLQRDLAAQGRHADLLRRIPARYARFVVFAESHGGYGVSAPDEFWNPRQEQWNACEWYDPKGEQERWAEWKVTAEEAGDYYFIFCWQSRGRSLNFSAADQSGKLVSELSLDPDGPVIRAIRFRLPQAGTYALRLVARQGEYAVARIAKAAFLVPSARASLLPPAVYE